MLSRRASLLGVGVDGIEMTPLLGVRQKRRRERVARHLEHLVEGEAQRLRGANVVVTDVATEVRGIVGVDGERKPVSKHLGEVVLPKLGKDPKLHVGERAHGERYLLRDETLDEALVFRALHSMIDTLHL